MSVRKHPSPSTPVALCGLLLFLLAALLSQPLPSRTPPGWPSSLPAPEAGRWRVDAAETCSYPGRRAFSAVLSGLSREEAGRYLAALEEHGYVLAEGAQNGDGAEIQALVCPGDKGAKLLLRFAGGTLFLFWDSSRDGPPCIW